MSFALFCVIFEFVCHKIARITLFCTLFLGIGRLDGGIEARLESRPIKMLLQAKVIVEATVLS